MGGRFFLAHVSIYVGSLQRRHGEAPGVNRALNYGRATQPIGFGGAQPPHGLTSSK